MNLLIIVESIGIGLILGLLQGLTGAGGSLIALPLLLSLHLPLQDAIGVSLGAVALSALVGSIPRAMDRQVAYKPLLILVVLGLPGNVFGQWLRAYIVEQWLISAFCLLVLWSAWRVWKGAALEKPEGQPMRYVPLVLLGVCVGILSGLLGVGGGFMIVPGLLWFTPLGMLQATATSMAVISIVSGGGFLLYLQHATPSLAMISSLFFGGSVGVLVGNSLAVRLGGPLLQRIFAVMLLLMTSMLALQKLILV